MLCRFLNPNFRQQLFYICRSERGKSIFQGRQGNASFYLVLQILQGCIECNGVGILHNPLVFLIPFSRRNPYLCRYGCRTDIVANHQQERAFAVLRFSAKVKIELGCCHSFLVGLGSTNLKKILQRFLQRAQASGKRIYAYIFRSFKNETQKRKRTSICNSLSFNPLFHFKLLYSLVGPSRFELLTSCV